MRCVESCVGDVEQRGWAHHIQRLMVLGNLALLAGVLPRQMTDWMWEGFIDGAEWVMVPNVVGMSLYADGGRMSTKPYAAGGAYIDRMSDYCKGCVYDRKQRAGDDRVPVHHALLGFPAPAFGSLRTQPADGRPGTGRTEAQRRRSHPAPGPRGSGNAGCRHALTNSGTGN